jgi:predicted Zn-ribbon and HTH transcriptional regulator
MKMKITTDDFIQKANLIHNNKYDYSKSIYTKTMGKLIIICEEHGEFEQTPNNHISKKSSCPKCYGNYMDKELFIEKANKIHDFKYDYSKVEYVNTSTNVIIICKIHGEFKTMPNSHISSKTGCGKCSNRFLDKDYFIEKANKIHNNKYDYMEFDYINNLTKIKITCKNHGVFTQTPLGHLVGNGCSKCGYLKNGEKSRKTLKQFISEANLIHNNIYDYSKVNYLNNYTNVIIICKIHGEFEQSSLSHVNQKNTCPKCTSNQYSKMAINWLNFIAKKDNINIKHAENTGEYLIPNTRLRVDGYCEKNKTIYEFHGDIWHGNPKIYNKNDKIFYGASFGELYDKTIEKETLIKKLGYNLVIIWEYDWKKINKSISILQRYIRCKIKKD